MIAVDRPNVVVETIKQAEDGNGVIVRLYESMRQRGPVNLTVNFDLSEVWRTNLLEENQDRLVGARQPGVAIRRAVSDCDPATGAGLNDE